MAYQLQKVSDRLSLIDGLSIVTARTSRQRTISDKHRFPGETLEANNVFLARAKSYSKTPRSIQALYLREPGIT